METKKETNPAVCIALGLVSALIAGALGGKVNHSMFLPFGIIGGAAGIIVSYVKCKDKGAIMAIIGFVIWFAIALAVRLATR